MTMQWDGTQWVDDGQSNDTSGSSGSVSATDLGYDSSVLGTYDPYTGMYSSLTNPTDMRLQDGTQTSAGDPITSLFSKFMTNGSWDLGKIAAAGLGVGAVITAYQQAKAGTPPTGYQGGIPKLTAVRQQLTPDTTGVRPGAGGIRYMTDTAYGTADSLGEKQGVIANQAVGLAAANAANTAQKAAQSAPTAPAATPAQKINAFFQANKSSPATVQAWMTQNGYSPLDVSQAVGMTVPQFNSYLSPPAATSTTTAAHTQAPATTGMGMNEATGQPAVASTTTPTAYTAPVPSYPGGPTIGGGNNDSFTPSAPAAQAPTGTYNDAQITDFINWQNAQLGLHPVGGFTNFQYDVNDPKWRAAAPAEMDLNAKRLAQNPNQAIAYTPNWQDSYATQKAAQDAQAAASAANRSPTSIGGGSPTGYAAGGIAQLANQPRYLQGATDGMADKIPATIDGQQPAALAHGEFVVPADVVSHLGNGNSDAGAQHLYSMMDRIRKARTGSARQGKEIDPSKFTGGGLAYAAGGPVQRFATGDVVTQAPSAASGVTGTESNLSNWAGPYVTDMLGKGQALSEQPYMAYQGPLTAGDSSLQSQAYGTAANLQTPASIGAAANTAGNVAQKAGDLNYAGQEYSSAYTAPQQLGYNAAQAQAAPNVSTGNFTDPGTASAYMSPYINNVMQTQMTEAQRQADIASTTRQSQQTQQNAFGGSRSAVMDADAARNLAIQKGDIQATGLQAAYNQAGQMYTTDQSRNLTAQQANQGVQQQTGMANQAATNTAAQFGAGQGLQSAAAGAQYGQAANALNVGQQQYGAGYGLQALGTQLNAAGTQGQLGTAQNTAGLANLNAQATLGGTQQATTQAGVAADQAAFNKEQAYPYQQVQFQQSLLQGLPLAAQSYNITTNPYAAAANTAGGLSSLFGSPTTA